MKRFAYWRDPLALAAVGTYALNRWVFIRLGAAGFWRNHFNDVLVIPAALPVLLWMHRRLGLRNHDDAPSALEVGAHLAVWAFVCEYAGPRWTARGTADPRDVLAYASGAAAAWLWWRFHYKQDAASPQ